jgi:STAM-binding protein
MSLRKCLSRFVHIPRLTCIRWGIFRLTDPPGLPHILSCQRTETFHPHSVDNLYVEAGHPQGHVYESKTLEFEVHDLRPGH